MDLRDVVLRDLFDFGPKVESFVLGWTDLYKVTYGVRVLDNLDRMSGSLDAQETVSGSCASREHATDYAVLIGCDHRQTIRPKLKRDLLSKQAVDDERGGPFELQMTIEISSSVSVR